MSVLVLYIFITPLWNIKKYLQNYYMKYTENREKYTVYNEGGAYFLVNGDWAVFWLVLYAWKSCWFGDIQKLWWWWLRYFLVGDLVTSNWKNWWFVDFEKLLADIYVPPPPINKNYLIQYILCTESLVMFSSHFAKEYTSLRK